MGGLRSQRDEQSSRSRGPQGFMTRDSNPDFLSEAVAKGADLLERDEMDFARWSLLMVHHFGEQIRPDLEDIWMFAHEERQMHPATQRPGSETCSSTSNNAPNQQKQDMKPTPSCGFCSSAVTAIRNARSAVMDYTRRITGGIN